MISTATILLLAANWADGPRPTFAARGAEIVGLVRQHLFDAATAENWAKRHEKLGSNARDDQSFADEVRQSLAELKLSHTAFYTVDDPQYYGLKSVFRAYSKTRFDFRSIADSGGIDATAEGFVRVVFAGGPGAKAGLKRGDRILTADGKSFHPVRSFRDKGAMPSIPSRHWTGGTTVALAVERTKGAPPLTIRIQPRKIDPMEEWVAAIEEGARIVERGGRKIGVVPVFCGAGEKTWDAIRSALTVKLSAADAAVVDLRDGWGGCGPEFLDLFNRAAPTLTSGGRDGKTASHTSSWRKPLAVLVNSGSRSGKEMVAFAIKKHKLGVLVGERTAGAVVAGRAFDLSDGSLLYLAVADCRVDGVRLEGVGVEPDVHVPDLLPYAEGKDLQLERAIELLAK